MGMKGMISRKSKNKIARVHESESEIWDSMYAPPVNQKYIGIPYIEFDLIDTQLRYPFRVEDKVIGQQVGGSFPELIFQNPEEHGYVNKGDMGFWFNEPRGGWRQGIARYYFLEEIPKENIAWPKQGRIFDGTLRNQLRNIVEGKCESIQLQHGLLIDFGCTFLGLLPIDES